MNNVKIPNRILWQSTAVGGFGGFCLGVAGGLFFKLDWVASGIAGMGIGSIFGHTSTLMLLARPQIPGFVDSRSYASETDSFELMTTDPDVSRGTFGKFPVGRRRMVILARGLVEGDPFTESQWTGGRQPFTVREFSQIRTVLIKSHWASWRNPLVTQRGVIITSAGLAVMRYLASHPRSGNMIRKTAPALARV